MSSTRIHHCVASNVLPLELQVIQLSKSCTLEGAAPVDVSDKSTVIKEMECD